MMLVANDCDPRACWAHGKLEAWMHFIPAVQLCWYKNLLSARTTRGAGSFHSLRPTCLRIQNLDQCCRKELWAVGFNIETVAVHRRRRSRIWRLHSDGAESEKVDEADNADRDGGISQADSTFQLTDKCPQPYGDSKNPVVGSIDDAASSREDKAACEPLLTSKCKESEAEAETSAKVPDERRDSLATRVPDQGDDLEEFYSEESDEGEDIKKEDDNPDGDGGVGNEENSRAMFQEDSTSDDKAQRPLLMSDSENDSEATKLQIFKSGSDLDGESKVDKEGESRLESLEATLLPEIFLHLLGFLPVQEVLEYNLQAVSRNFSSREVWMIHLFNLVDFDSFQALSDVPPLGREFTAALRIFTQCTDRSLSTRERLASPLLVQYFTEASEGFQGCHQVWFGPWAEKLQGKYLAQANLIEEMGTARFPQSSDEEASTPIGMSQGSSLPSPEAAKAEETQELSSGFITSSSSDEAGQLRGYVYGVHEELASEGVSYALHRYLS
eukprot:s272_g41.t4